MRRDTYAPYLLLAYTVLAMVVACLSALPGIVRLPMILPLIVLVPGHLLLRALDTATNRNVLDHLMFAIGTSLALTVLVGVALNWSPWGLSGASQALALGGIALVCGGVALRRHPAPLGLPALPPLWRVAMPLALAGIICVGALALARAGASAQPRPGFTQMWLVPVANHTGEVQLGLTNQERATHTYRVVLADHGHVTTTWSGITLADAATWQLTFSVAPGALLEADVYLDSAPTTRYRHVTLTSNG